MAGRGRGRGSNITFNIEALGLTKADIVPVSVEQPPPNFPPLQFKAIPLLQSDKLNYLLALKQEFRAAVKELPFYYTPEEKKKDIKRYSDKYQNGHDSATDWQPDWNYLPDELKTRKKMRKAIAPCISKRKVKLSDDINAAQTLANLENKEKQENQEGDAEEKESDEEEKDEEEIQENEVYDEEDMEEETDYIMSYFDNGEDLDEEDDNIDDGPTYS